MLPVAQNSLAFRLFSDGIYQLNNTFAGLAFDARFNWGFSDNNKDDIVDAYFAWLKSKVVTANLRSVYLAGHSRGGALVLRLAKKFQEELPNVVVIVHAFDAVPNRSHGELNAYSSSIDNPIAGFPRNTGGLNNKGNWAWKTDMRSFYSDKTNLSVFNLPIGGKIFGLAQEVRAVTHESADQELNDLGWYFQRWYDMPGLGFIAEDAGGHNAIARSNAAINDALDIVEDRLDVLLNNIAPEATASASSTFCSGTGNNCYAASRVNDSGLDTRVGGFYSWTNNGSSNQWVRLRWPRAISTDYLEVFTSERFPIQDYRIEYLDGNTWRTLITETGNEQLHIRHDFSPIQTTEIRLVGLLGPNNQTAFSRVNELVVVGDWVEQPNQGPTARCTVTPNSGRSPLRASFNGSGSTDADGSITSYRWSFGDSSSGSGRNTTHTYITEGDQTENFSVRLTVTDNDGASASTFCGVTVLCDPTPGGIDDGFPLLCPQ